MTSQGFLSNNEVVLWAYALVPVGVCANSGIFGRLCSEMKLVKSAFKLLVGTLNIYFSEWSAIADTEKLFAG